MRKANREFLQNHAQKREHIFWDQRWRGIILLQIIQLKGANAHAMSVISDLKQIVCAVYKFLL